MTHEDIVSDIERFGWNLIRWGHQPFSATLIEALLKGQSQRNWAPEYFLVGEAAAAEIKQLDADMPAVHFPSEQNEGDAICTIAGCPVFLSESMPKDILALIFPNNKLSLGDKMEMTANVASYIETTGADHPCP